MVIIFLGRGCITVFGYVKPFKPDMRMCEYDTYKAIYCGLCHQLGKTFGPFSRFTLNYDFTFLALLANAVNPDKNEFKHKICPGNPLKKKLAMQPCRELEFSASAALVILYYKVIDNISDNGFFSKIGYTLLKPFASLYKKKATKHYPTLDEIIGNQLKRQAELEKQKFTTVDSYSDPTAIALSGLFSLLSENDTQKKVLDRFGYLLGRWIYLMDALDDFEDDIKSGTFNPFATTLNITTINNETVKLMLEQAEKTLNFTVTELAAAYELIDINRYKTIMDNIVYLGLKNTQNIIIKKIKEKYN